MTKAGTTPRSAQDRQAQATHPGLRAVERGHVRQAGGGAARAAHVELHGVARHAARRPRPARRRLRRDAPAPARQPRPAGQRHHIRRAIAMYRSLLRAGVVERLDEPDADDRLVRVTIDLQADFALNQPLSPSCSRSPTSTPTPRPRPRRAVDRGVGAREPGVVIAAQLDRLRTETIERLKREVEYEQRMAELDKLEHPACATSPTVCSTPTPPSTRGWSTTRSDPSRRAGPLRAGDDLHRLRRVLPDWPGQRAWSCAT